MRRLFDAIRQVESGGGRRVLGDGGRSRGPYQIGRAYWQDACEYGGLRWRYDRWIWDARRCEYVMHLYWLRYGVTTDEQRARVHNGGPRGHRKPGTRKYWARVQAAMKSDRP